MRGRQVRGPVPGLDLARHAPAVQRVGAAVGDPQPGGVVLLRRVQGAEHQGLVIAEQGDGLGEPRRGGAAGQEFHHPGGIGATVDQVAEMDQHRARDRALGEVGGDRGVQGLQPLQAAVDVADGVDAQAGCKRGRRRRLVEHGAGDPGRRRGRVRLSDPGERAIAAPHLSRWGIV